MHAEFQNHDAAKLDEETTSSVSPRMRIICAAEKAAEKSTEAWQHSDMGFNKLFSKYLVSRGLRS